MSQQIPLAFDFKANHTFADFFSGPNQEIVDYLQHCVNGGSELYIYLSGNAGSGKSHLLQACCHYAQHLGLRPFYFDLTTASNPDPDILNGIERCEIVCLDNLEVIADNSDWEYAFFNFFNLHRDHGHKLITAASCPPSMLKIQLPDLQTRINWGLTLRLKALSDQDRIEALILKAHQLGFDLAPQLGRFLVCRYDRDPQALWRMLDKINLASLAAKRKLTLPFLKQVLGQEVHDA